MVGRVQLRRGRIATMLFQKFAGGLDIGCEQLGNIPVHVRPTTILRLVTSSALGGIV